MPPAEVRHLRTTDVHLPDDITAWGTLTLDGSTQTAGRAWTDSGSPDAEDRALKHRARRATRDVPSPPELGQALRRHLESFTPGVGGRLFVTRAGRAGVPVNPPYASPQSMDTVYRVWDLARRKAFTAPEYESRLAKRPYDLRHAAVSLWLNSGVPATQVAEWAGHSVNVLLRVYAACIVGQDEQSRHRVERALRGHDPAAEPVRNETSPRFPCASRRRPLTTATRRTPGRDDRRASDRRFRWSEALLCTWWQVKDSNLRSSRDGFTVRAIRAPLPAQTLPERQTSARIPHRQSLRAAHVRPAPDMSEASERVVSDPGARLPE